VAGGSGRGAHRRRGGDERNATACPQLPGVQVDAADPQMIDIDMLVNLAQRLGEADDAYTA
jgi:hypothetical protein